MCAGCICDYADGGGISSKVEYAFGEIHSEDTPSVPISVMNSSATGDRLWLTMGWLRRRVRFGAVVDVGYFSDSLSGGVVTTVN